MENNTEETKTEDAAVIPEIQEVNAENLLSTDSNSESEKTNEPDEPNETQKEEFVVSPENIKYMTDALIWIFGSGAIIAYNLYFEDKIVEKDLYTAGDKVFLRPHYDVISEKLCRTFGIGKKGDNLMMAITFITLGTGMSLQRAQKQSEKDSKKENKAESKPKEAKEEKEKPSFNQENENIFEVKEIRKNGLSVEENKPKKGRPRKN